jgi:hypothetical protein
MRNSFRRRSCTARIIPFQVLGAAGRMPYAAAMTTSSMTRPADRRR